MVFVVGGFGRNPYLYRKVQEYCSQRGIGTRQPQNPWSAVARGAVCRGLEGGANNLVAVRLARKHYGTAAAELFRPGVHHQEDLHVDEITGRRLARGQMTWLCEKGDRLAEAQPKTIGIEVSRLFEPHDAREVAGVLVGCTEDVAPKRFADPAAQVICRVRGDFSDIPLSNFPKSRSAATGKEYYELDFKLEATFRSDDITWRLLYRGKEYGSTTVTYED